MIVKTKLSIPHIHGTLVPRPRLTLRLNEGLETKLTLVSAQAGYGKSTALSQWAQSCSLPVAWISLDTQDNDWIQFWSYVTASVEALIPGFGHSVLPLLKEGPSSPSVSSPSSEPAIKTLLNELNRITQDIALVIDDYQFINLPSIHQSMAYFIEHLPPLFHLYIASRTELTIPTARLLAKGQLQRVTTDDLRFQLDESFVYFENRADLSLTRKQTAELLHQTEGWISGLQLAAISLGRSSNREESLRRFSGRTRHISDYLLEEVFENLAEPLRFLLETSILTRMNHSLCEAVTGRNDCQAQLARLEQLNLFIIPLDEERYWYRYHHLLSDFLRHAFSIRDPDKRAQAHARAAHWLESQGFVEDAAEHYLAGRRYEDIVRLMEHRLLELIHKKMIALSGWVLQVPESFIMQRPMVEMFYLLLLIAIGQWEAASAKIDLAKARYEALKETLNETVWQELMGNVYFLCGVSSYLRKDLADTQEYFYLADRHLPNGGLFTAIGNNNHHSFEEFDDHLAFINDHHGSASFLTAMFRIWRLGDGHPLAGPLYATYSKLLYEWNRLDEAAACIGQVLRQNDTPLIGRTMLHIYISASRIEQTLGNQTRAANLLEQVKSRIDSPDYDLYVRKIEAEQACLAIRQGDIPSATAWLDRCGMTYSDEISLGAVAEHLALSKVLAACGRAEEALTLSERLDALLFKEDRLRDRIKAIIMQSMSLHAIGRLEEGLVRLETALVLAESQGFIRSFVDEGPGIAELLAMRLNKHPSDRYAQRLLAAIDVVPDSRPRIRAKVTCFNRFKVEAGTPGGEEIKWRTSKAEELFAYLVHHRGEAVDRYRIMDALWGSESEKTTAYLNTSVYYLRKNLASIGIEGILQHNRGYYRIDVGDLDCDYLRFHSFVSSGESIDHSNIRDFEDIAKLYAGHYLEKNHYAWAEEARRTVENDYVVLLLRINDYYTGENDWSSGIKMLKTVLKLVPWNEEIHAKLIRAHLANNDRLSAMKQYDALRRTLQTEFKLEPGTEVKKMLNIK
ncbi:BTAD domain-containing putative transcriptional regulator [Cohnella lupini]|uniref:LuxR family maltose regulon positive regulatory protein n=1 Tax=Cohnella lupini TaxID=1294267 RepID=A0A3D9I266_9BACL|nr:BTAD domain-containing putative transcriptional regulator [Cohnella lupini]RED55741.1 LuxR family maltose regulon positive regulatory protein [Cohnella lupini]